MKRSSGPRQTAHLFESVYRRLNMYALARNAPEWECSLWPKQVRPGFRAAKPPVR
jgi:hypothetical protein